VFELEQVLAGKLAALPCDEPPPITGAFSGSLDCSQVLGAPTNIRFDWEGTLDLVPQTTIGGVPVPVTRPGSPVTYVVRTGTLTARLRGSTGDCTITGQASFDAKGLNGGGEVLVMSTTEGDPDTYRLFMGAGNAAVPTVLSACTDPQQNGRTGMFPMLAIALMDFTKEHQVTTEGVFQGTGSQPGSASDGAYTWSWSFRS